MPTVLKFHCPLRLDFEVREKARKEGRTISDTLLRLVERSLGSSPPVEMEEEAIVDLAERGSHGSKAIALYLSKPLASAVRKLAQEQDRSTSWIARDLAHSEQ
jgi:hypothetical protein